MSIIGDATADWPRPGRPEDRAEAALAELVAKFVAVHGPHLSGWLANARDEYEAQAARVWAEFEVEKGDRRLRDALDAKLAGDDATALDAIRRRVAS